jgi:hypothetical protein
MWLVCDEQRTEIWEFSKKVAAVDVTAVTTASNKEGKKLLIREKTEQASTVVRTSENKQRTLRVSGLKKTQQQQTIMAVSMI